MSKDTTDTALTNADSKEVSKQSHYTYAPRVDIHEDEHAFYVEAEMPGVAEGAVDVKLEEGVLTLLGQVEPLHVDGYQRVYTEYQTGNYERSFRITDAVDAERIEATLKHGVLKLTLPKREAIKPRRIEVRVA
jgi:HSP20 family molecular chaperone IbpA